MSSECSSTPVRFGSRVLLSRAMISESEFCRANPAQPDPWPTSQAWFCLRTQPKHEHIAAAQLRQTDGVEVFLPRIRFKRLTRCGPVWVTEALFQNYVFARFDFMNCLRRVQAARGVSGVVHFGSRWPTIPDAAIEELQQAMQGQELHVVEEPLRPGDRVQITEGAMQGLEAVVCRVMPARQRVAVLLDFLGRQTMVELERSQLVTETEDGFRKACLGTAPGRAGAGT